MDALSKITREVSITRLERIYHPAGDVLHGMKSSDSTYRGFGEAYFTSVLKGSIKGWKRHNKMVLNLIVPHGSVAFYIYDDVSESTERVVLGETDYHRLTVAPGLWMAFEGLGDTVNLILNIASIEHDPAESDNKPLSAFSIKR